MRESVLFLIADALSSPLAAPVPLPRLIAVRHVDTPKPLGKRAKRRARGKGSKVQ